MESAKFKPWLADDGAASLVGESNTKWYNSKLYSSKIPASAYKRHLNLEA